MHIRESMQGRRGTVPNIACSAGTFHAPISFPILYEHTHARTHDLRQMLHLQILYIKHTHMHAPSPEKK